MTFASIRNRESGRPRVALLMLGLAALMTLILGSSIDSDSIVAQEDSATIEIEGRIALQRAGEDGAIVGFLTQGAETILPDPEPLKVQCAFGEWLESSAVTYQGATLGRIVFRQLDNGWIEVGFRQVDGEDVLPRLRFTRPGTDPDWVVSSIIVISIPRPDATPRFTSGVPNQFFDPNEEIRAFELPEADVTWWDLSYSLEPDVPGLTFDSATRRLSGTPTEVQTYSMVYRAESSEGGSAELRFAIFVDDLATDGMSDDSMTGDDLDDSMMEEEEYSAEEAEAEEESQDSIGESDKVDDSSRSPLSAGEIDDNERWTEYLRYRDDYSWLNVHDVDISERYIITVSDSRGQGVPNARVKVSSGQCKLFEGRTYANGQTLFFPRAFTDNDAVESFTLQVEKDGASQRLEFPRSEPRQWNASLELNQSQETGIPLDILFLLDSTGSMSDEIDQIKDTLLSIASRISDLPVQPDLRFGMVAYRDRGDVFVTRVFDFEADAELFLDTIRGVEARGGGDYPESLNEAMHMAVHEPQWRLESGIRLMFLIADAPPQLNYANDYSYADEMIEAHRRGIKTYAIASSGLDEQGEYIFRQIAQHTMGRFIFIVYGQDGDTPHSVGQYTIQRLDDLVVALVEEELAYLSRGSDN